MHGIRRNKLHSTIEKAEEEKRSKFLAEITRSALIFRRKLPLQVESPQFEDDYQIVEKALIANPDEYSLWTFRREVLLEQSKYPSLFSIDQLWQSELKLTVRALKQHPKAYPAWSYRLWLLQEDQITNQISSQLLQNARQQEQYMSASMLTKDSRNFHGWAHRMRTKSMIQSDEIDNNISLDKQEYKFVTEKINDDFANYSAWHYRSVILSKLHPDPNSFLDEELNFVRQALYTEPDVQSAWFYYRWLLAGAPSHDNKPNYDHDRLIKELKACNELLSIEPDIRSALQTKVIILLELHRGNEALDVIENLLEVDPMRKGFYEHLKTKALACT